MPRPNRWHYLDAPVGDTCPLIDEVQAAIADAIAVMQSFDLNEEEDAARKEQIAMLTSAQKDIMEQIRGANTALRQWGAQGQADLEAAQKELKDAEQERDQLQRTVDRLEREAA